jgi:hypothetical protein
VHYQYAPRADCLAQALARHGEFGRELIAAKDACKHGEWLPWLDREFGWTVRTAQAYMAVAEAFQSANLAHFGGLTIDATALYALAAR